MPLDKAVYLFVVDVLRRERKRIAKHLTRTGVHELIVQGILDDSEDFIVFHHNGPVVGLNDPCTGRDLPK